MQQEKKRKQKRNSNSLAGEKMGLGCGASQMGSEDLWQLQNKFLLHNQDRTHRRSTGGNYTSLSRPNSQHIYVDLDSSTSSFSSETNAISASGNHPVAKPAPSGGVQANKAYVVSQCWDTKENK